MILLNLSPSFTTCSFIWVHLFLSIIASLTGSIVGTFEFMESGRAGGKDCFFRTL